MFDKIIRKYTDETCCMPHSSICVGSMDSLQAKHYIYHSFAQYIKKFSPNPMIIIHILLNLLLDEGKTQIYASSV